MSLNTNVKKFQTKETLIIHENLIKKDLKIYIQTPTGKCSVEKLCVFSELGSLITKIIPEEYWNVIKKLEDITNNLYER